jgi:hypothetical protein
MLVVHPKSWLALLAVTLVISSCGAAGRASREMLPITLISRSGPFPSSVGPHLFAATSLRDLATRVDDSGAYPSFADCQNAHTSLHGSCWTTTGISADSFLLAVEVGPIGSGWNTSVDDTAVLDGSKLTIVELTRNDGSLSQGGSTYGLSLYALDRHRLPHGAVAIVVTHRFASPVNSTPPDETITVAIS